MSFQLDSVLENMDNQPVNIVEDIYAYLSPFSAHQINIWGETFATVEHAYQAHRFKDSPEREAVKNAKSPLQAWLKAQEFKKNPEVFIDRSRVELAEIVEELFKVKHAQHEEIRKILEMTKGRGILKIFGKDSYWGTGEDGTGENMMGKIWMKIRDEK
jgi:ribA/ribD-fused uncharacterized protein